MARTVREAGRPRADWEKDALIVRTWVSWAQADGWRESSVKNGRFTMRRFHDLLIERHGTRDYFRPEHNIDLVDWEDAIAFRDGLLARARAGEIAPKWVPGQWNIIRAFYEWRAQSDAKNPKYARDLENIRKYWSLPKLEARSTGGYTPYKLEHLHKIADAAKSYSMIQPPTGGHGKSVESEDYYVTLLLLYTGGRAQFYGLRWDQIDFERGFIGSKAKMGAYWEIPMHPALAEAMRELRLRNPTVRMVFRYGSYPYFDGVPAAKSARCEYANGERCAVRENCATYYGRDRDYVYCPEHLHRTLTSAQATNGINARRTLLRVEKALHEHFPNVVEEVRERSGERKSVPVHLHPHRFRKSLVTHGIALGLTAEMLAKIFGWKSAKVVEGFYNVPDADRKREGAQSFDLVDVSRRAEAGERVRAKSPEDLLREENAALRGQISTLTAQLATLSAQFAEFMARFGGGTPAAPVAVVKDDDASPGASAVKVRA